MYYFRSLCYNNHKLKSFLITLIFSECREVGCVDQSSNVTAKLIVTDATHVVRFAEEERLWSYEVDGSNNLDSRCIAFKNINTVQMLDDTPTTSPMATPTKEPTDSGDTPTISPVATPTKEPTDDPSDDSREDDGFYNCDEMNPCGVQENIAADKFYFPASDPAKYIQCGMSSEMCFVKTCGPGTHWDQEQLVCGWAGMNLYYSLLCSAGITSLCEYNK